MTAGSVKPDSAISNTPFMFPLMLNVVESPIMLVGAGELPIRISALEKHGAQNIVVFAPDASEELTSRARDRLNGRWPTQEDFEHIRPQLVFIADVDDAFAGQLRSYARSVGALVHVQDRIPLCDFHLPAIVRRGHLQVTVSTDGTAAGLSRLIREFLEKNIFGPEWAERVEELALARQKWKQQGLSFEALSRAIQEFVSARKWFSRE